MSHDRRHGQFVEKGSAMTEPECTCGEAYGTRRPGGPKCDYCEYGTGAPKCILGHEGCGESHRKELDALHAAVPGPIMPYDPDVTCPSCHCRFPVSQFAKHAGSCIVNAATKPEPSWDELRERIRALLAKAWCQGRDAGVDWGGGPEPENPYTEEAFSGLEDPFA